KVKQVTTVNGFTFASCSRDGQVLVWQRDTAYNLMTQFSLHQGFVNALYCLKPGEDNPHGLVVSGGQDKLIYCFDPFDPTPIYTLVGHTDNICALHGHGDTIISGSWDKTAKVWRKGQLIHTLSGHTASVWGVLCLNESTFVTAGADKTIKLWNNGQLKKSIIGHADVVRQLSIFSDVGFLSSSNDGTIKLWSWDLELVYELHGHTSFVYSTTVLPNGHVVSCGEDRSCRIWSGPDLVQTITLPCISVWSVTGLENGDFVCGGSDGLVRVFTEDPTRAFENAVASAALPKSQLGDIDKNKLPGLEALNIVGTRDGQTKMIRVGNAVEAHQWSDATASWVKIGEVVDAVGSNRKQLYEGKEYDFVFDVDIQDGVPPLKLPYNATDNPYEVAQQFMHRYELPQDYLDQIANFIIKNSEAVTIGQTSNPDPYTGSQVKAQTPRQYSFFTAANLQAVETKIVQVNGEVQQKINLESLKSVIQMLADQKVSKFGVQEWQTVIQICQWPRDKRFPGLDLLRLLILHVSPLQFDTNFFEPVIQHLQPSQFDKPGETNCMLSLRILANGFNLALVRAAILTHKQQILDATDKIVSGNKNLQLAKATLLFKY
ncbi:WD40-repeat-containing domain protein, partial [Gorgonomyces haynaldii]